MFKAVSLSHSLALQLRGPRPSTAIIKPIVHPEYIALSLAMTFSIFPLCSLYLYHNS